MKSMIVHKRRLKTRNWLKTDMLACQMVASSEFIQAFFYPSDVNFAKGIVRRKWGKRHFAFKIGLQTQKPVYPFPLIF